ncbi:7-O-carbamoyltransferase [Phycisphaerales bacterium]|nr:7-O-carbamoyltransferase [Phycisphaerales bacterium]
MSRLILGLNSIHPDASAVLMNEKGVIAAIAEERINRKKHCAGFPSMAIAEVLRIGGASVGDITDVAIARDSRANLAHKALFVLRHPVSGGRVAAWSGRVHKKIATAPQLICEAVGQPASAFKGTVHHVEHHVAHIASAFFWSKFERATGLSTDGAGDFSTGIIARCEGNRIDVLRKNYWPHSFGVFYTAVCNFLGFNKYGEEYKVMGLSAYGQDAFAEQMKTLVDYTPQRGMRLNLPYYRHHNEAHTHDETEDGEIKVKPMWSAKMRELFGEPRPRGGPMTQRERDMSCSMQRRFEAIYKAYVNDAVARAGSRDMVMAGGCTLNGVANGQVITEGLIDRVYIHPAAGDDGTAAGAACYVMHSVLGIPRIGEVSQAYWGTGWTDAEIEKDALASGMPFKKLSRDQLLATTADALSKGKIVGWFQGREEWGPRALGNRSIICHPGWPDMKAILNARVKNREPFRPFAPLIMAERLSDCFEGSHDVPFMNVVYKVRPEWRQKLSATTHEDATGRVQTMRRDQNDLFYDLLVQFNQRTGVPVLLNTSFNENEPIVHTPKHAIDCFKRTRMDALAVGSFWYQKPDDEAHRGEAV